MESKGELGSEPFSSTTRVLGSTSSLQICCIGIKAIDLFLLGDKATYYMLDKVADQPFLQRVLNLWDIQIVSKCDLKQNMQINCNFRS